VFSASAPCPAVADVSSVIPARWHRLSVETAVSVQAARPTQGERILWWGRAPPAPCRSICRT
jgi:hypothetical protein